MPAAAVARLGAVDVTRGDCLRFPQTVMKKADEVCGEHPDLVHARTLPLRPSIAAVPEPQAPRRFGRNR